MKFNTYGRTLQLSITTPEDLTTILTLDETHWVATSAPTSAFQLDPAFLAYLDGNGDGRVYSDELKAAIRWLFNCMADVSHLGEGRDAVPLTAIQTDAQQGAAILESARTMLRTLGEHDSETISLETVRTFIAAMQTRPLNGDGVIVPASGDDAETTAFLQHVLTATGGTPDASGRQGVTEQQLDRFLEAIPAYLEWHARGLATAAECDTSVLPLGADTPHIYEVYARHADEVNHFFQLCALVKFDPRAATRITDSEKLQALDFLEAERVQAYLQEVPLATPGADGSVPLDGGNANPLYRDWLEQLRTDVLVHVLGRDTTELTEADWRNVEDALAPYRAYLDQNPAPFLHTIPCDVLATYQAPEFADKARRLIAEDKQVTVRLQRARDVERLLLYHKHLMEFANNFVSFPDLYSDTARALFETGSIAMDGRWLNLAVVVNDVPAHAAVAKAGNLYVAYLEITGPPDVKTKVVAPLTSGTKGNITVGKRGVFFDVHGKEFDARVIQVIENPVSLREALAMPFVRLWRLVEGKIEGWSGSSEKELQVEFNKALAPPATATAAAIPQPAAGANTARPGGLSGGSLFLGLGVALAALGSAFAFITKTFAGMALYKVLAGVAVAAFLVLFPVSLIAFLKLSRQDLSPLLEGCGWAINARMRLTRGQRRYFTRRMPYPAGASGTPRRRLLVVLIILLALTLALALWQWLR